MPAHTAKTGLFGAPRVALRPSAGLAAFRDAGTWCTANPYVAADFNFSAAAESLVSARGKLVATSHAAQWRKEGHTRFDTAPAPVACAPLSRFPADGKDGGKWLCNLPSLTGACVIYSLGSNGQYEFEHEMIFNTPCEIHTFDCTHDPVVALHPRITYHKICLGDDSADGRYRSLSSIAASLGHTHISLLKMDIEGFEYAVVESLFRQSASAAHLLPSQISFELHYRTAAPVAWTDSGTWPLIEQQALSAGDMSLLWVQLADLGYVVVSREDNFKCIWCSEFTILRAFC